MNGTAITHNTLPSLHIYCYNRTCLYTRYSHPSPSPSPSPPPHLPIPSRCSYNRFIRALLPSQASALLLIREVETDAKDRPTAAPENMNATQGAERGRREEETEEETEEEREERKKRGRRDEETEEDRGVDGERSRLERERERERKRDEERRMDRGNNASQCVCVDV